MELWSLGYLLVILWLNTFANSAETDPRFTWIPLGESSFLIKWWLPESKRNGSSTFSFVVTKNTDDEPENFFHRTLTTPYEFNSIIIPSFEPDAKYRVLAKISGNNFPKSFVTSFDIQTNKVISEFPLKPNFEYEIQDEPFTYPLIKITWLPCGMLGNCSNGVAGNFFYVKYAEQYDPGFVNVRAFRGDIAILNRCRPGRVYKVKVISVLDDEEMESDTKEIIMPDPANNFEIKEAITSENISLTCKFRSFAGDEVLWDLSWRSPDASELAHFANGDIRLNAVSIFDSGLYNCYLQSNPNNTASTFLDVKAATRIDNSAEFDEIRVISGKSFRIDCCVTSDRTLGYFVKWLKNGKEIDFSNNRQQINAKNNALLIPKVEKEHSGNYTCLAITRLDSANATLVLNVI